MSGFPFRPELDEIPSFHEDKAMVLTTALTLLQLSYQLLLAAQGANIPEWQRQQAISTANNAISYAQNVIQSQGGYNNPYNPYNPYYPYNPGTGQNTGSVQIIIAGNGIEDNFRRGQYYNIVWSPSNPSFGTVNVELLNPGTNTVVAFIGQSASNSVSWLSNVAPGNYIIRLTQSGNILGTRSVLVL